MNQLSSEVELEDLIEGSIDDLEIDPTRSMEWETSSPAPMAIGTIVDTVIIHC
jgi:hypothetical protein